MERTRFNGSSQAGTQSLVGQPVIDGLRRYILYEWSGSTQVQLCGSQGNTRQKVTTARVGHCQSASMVESLLASNVICTIMMRYIPAVVEALYLSNTHHSGSHSPSIQLTIPWRAPSARLNLSADIPTAKVRARSACGRRSLIGQIICNTQSQPRPIYR